MTGFRDLAIKHKLMLIAAFTSSTALVLACAGFVAFEIRSSQDALVRRLAAEADLIGMNSTAALAFEDRRASEETLRTLRSNARVNAAAIYSADGTRFATFVRDERADLPPPVAGAQGHEFASGRLALFRDIVLGGERLGSVFVESDLGELQGRLKRYALITGVVMVVSLGVSLLVASWLQRPIARPLSHLALTARAVAVDRNYSARAVKESGDEIGTLIDAFNEMLAEIQKRDAALNAANDMLERRVQERTRALEQEVAERRRAEAELRVSETRYRLVSLATNDAIWDWDVGAGTTTRNDGMQKLFGYAADEVGSAYGWWAGRIHEEDRARVEASLAAFVAGDDVTWSAEYRFRRRDGGYAFVTDRGYVVRDDAGKAVRVIGSIADVTERRRAEIAMQAAKDAAEAANRAKSEFLANMSHEIRTPMNGIVGMVALLLDTPVSREQREYLELMRGSSDALLTVVNNVLDFSKIEAGRLELEPIPFALRDALDETLKTLALRAHGKGLELACHVRPDVPDALVGDPGRLRQVLLNLVGNAIKFTDRGQVVLGVEIDPAPGELLLHFAVSDTGIGIAPAKQKAIFAAFTQADGSTTRKYGGTGLGLTISTQIVEMMGGRLWVESVEGKGSTFHFTSRFGLRPAQAPAARAAPATLAGMSALVIDDNEVNRRILIETLTDWGMDAQGVSSGAEGLRALKQARAPHRLVLLDSTMPGMDGFDVAARIRNDASLSGAVIMMLTSAGQRGDAARCRALGIKAYLMKPIKESDLLEAVLAVLGLVPSAQAQPSLVTRHSLRERCGGRRVLLVEDNPVNRTLAARLLEKHAHCVVAVSNGREALETLKTASFDVAVMDLQMPEMGGLEATRAIRAAERATGGRLPIVAMTAHALRDDRERCLRAGMDAYITKPIKPDDLLEAIERLTAGPAATAAPAPGADGAGAGAVGGAPTPTTPFDREAALQRVGGDARLLAEIITLFLDEVPARIRQVKKAVVARDLRGVERAAHALRGALVNLEARPAAAAAERLETLARGRKRSGIRAASSDLEREIAALRKALSGAAAGHAA